MISVSTLVISTRWAISKEDANATQRPPCVISVTTPPFSGKRQSCRERMNIQCDDYLDAICIHHTHMQARSQEDLSQSHRWQTLPQPPYIYCGALVKDDKWWCVIKVICSFMWHCSTVICGSSGLNVGLQTPLMRPKAAKTWTSSTPLIPKCPTTNLTF